MSLRLSPRAEAVIRQKVEAGLYQSADEAIEEAVRLLDARDQQVQRLRTKLQLGLDSGEAIPVTPELMDEIEREAEAAFQRGDTPDPDVCP